MTILPFIRPLVANLFLFRRMKIVSIGYSKTAAFINPEAWLTQISFYTGLLEELAKHHTVESIERINYEGLYYQNGVAYHFVQLTKEVERFPLQLHRVLKQLQPDVVLVNGFSFPLQILQLRMAVGKKVKILVLHRAEKPMTGVRKWVQLAAGTCVNAYLFASDEISRQWTVNGHLRNGNKVHEVLQASSAFQPKEKRNTRKALGVTGSPVYLWVGRLEQNKDPLTVVTAFVRFWQRHPSARLFLIFQTEELLQNIRVCIRNAGAEEAIELVGKQPRHQLEEWYNSADFFLSGSHEESCGIALLEAMSCGCIPIITDIASFRTITAGCGLLYPAGDEDALLSRLQESLHIDQEEQRKKALQHFQSELSFSAIAQKLTTLLHNLP